MPEPPGHENQDPFVVWSRRQGRPFDEAEFSRPPHHEVPSLEPAVFIPAPQLRTGWNRRKKSVKPRNSDAEAERLLIERTRAGSSEALADLVQIHSPRVYKWSLRILKNHEDAEDNTQKVLWKMYLNINTFKGCSRLSTWLFRMTVNEALMEKRRARSQSAECGSSTPEQYNDCIPEIRDERADPEQQCLAKELVARAFLGLQPSLAKLFIRHKGEGWTQRELADKLGISVAALKARIFSARARMLARLHASS
jgi:RNA polymerase sigma-70 factor, ECF subfamily